MFGYVTINQEELKMKDYRTYRAYYCGLCRSLQRRYGARGRVLLTYDMTFLGMLLTSLYEQQGEMKEQRCLLHPTKKDPIVSNELLEYAADMNILLSFHNFMDDWYDDKSVSKLTLAKMLKRQYQEAAKRNPGQEKAIRRYMQSMRACEKKNVRNLDVAAGLTGAVLKELFMYKDDEWKDALGEMGFYLGKFIYLMDAYEDVEKDKKKESYNPLIAIEAEKNFEDKCHDYLMLMMADCCRAFERLPIIENIDILRNILYSGVWVKYERVRKERAGKQK